VDFSFNNFTSKHAITSPEGTGGHLLAVDDVCGVVDGLAILLGNDRAET